MVKERSLPAPSVIVPPAMRYNTFLADPNVRHAARRVTAPERDVMVAVSLRRDALPLHVRHALFADLAAVFDGREPENPPDFGGVAAIMIEHAELLIECMGEVHAMRQFRRHATWYTKGFRGSAQLRQALTNVLSNAYKYSPQGGPIRLHTLERAFDGVAHVGVAVTDSGIGMTSAQKARLFERFYRADPSGNIPGTGLGMCLVQEIMELQGGQIEVDSEPGIGTRVTLWFAVVAQPADVPA